MLLGGDSEEITTTLGSMSREVDKLESDIMTLLIHMKGAVSISDAYNMSVKQIELAIKSINDYYKSQTDSNK